MQTDIWVSVWCARWCAPYAYKERLKLGCGGADKWTVEPAADAFPLTHWDAGSGTIYCDPGYFCANTTSRVQATMSCTCVQLQSQAAITCAWASVEAGRTAHAMSKPIA